MENDDVTRMRRLNREFHEIHDFIDKSEMKMSVLKLRGQMWKVIIHGPPETIFEGKNQAFIVQFPQGYPFDPPMIYTADEDIRLPFLLGGNIAPFKILSKNWFPACPISLPITALYYHFIINGKAKSENDPSASKETPFLMKPIEIPKSSFRAFVKTVNKRVEAGTLSEKRAKNTIDMAINLAKKAVSSENAKKKIVEKKIKEEKATHDNDEIDEELEQLYERKRVLEEQIRNCDKKISHYEKLCNLA